MASEGAGWKTTGLVDAGAADTAGSASDATGTGTASSRKPGVGRSMGGDGQSGGQGARRSAKSDAAAKASEAAAAAGPASGESVRIDSWIWSVRLVKTRSTGTTACRGGHVHVNGERVKPAHSVRVGDEVRLRHAGRERIVIVKRLVRKRVGAPVAVECYVDNSPPAPPRDAVAPAGIRDRGTGRPTKRDRRDMERLLGLTGRGGAHGSL
jgi:ribosome-associated heat shock protein Hsp15